MGINGFTNPTPLGELPTGWTVQSIESLCQKVTSGGTPLRSNPDFYQNGTIRWFKTKELNDGYIHDSEEKITPVAIEKTSAKLFPPNTVLMAMYGDGHTITSLGILRKESATNQACCALIADSAVCNYRFLFYALKHHRNDFIQIATGGAQRNLSGTLIRNFAIKVPPLDEQKAIAQILSSLDDKIELNQQMNQTLKAIARALFKSWFIDFDPVRAKMDGRQPAGMDAETAALFPDEFEDGGAIGQIPRGWRVQKLIEITSKIGSGATPRGGSQVYVDEGISLIRSQNVYDYQFSWDGLARITEEMAEQLRNVVVEPNDILLNITGDSILRTCVVEPAVMPARVNQHVSIIRAIPEIPCRYLHLYLVQPQMKSFLLGFDTGGTRKAVTKGQLESVPVPVPSEAILLHFRKITDPLFERINANLAESRALTSVRDALLPKLLSGKVRVQDAEKVVEQELSVVTG